TVPQSAFLVGMIGLSTFVPVLLLALPGGETADRYNRRRVILIALSLEIASVLTLAVAAWWGVSSIPLLLAMAALFGAGRAFYAPASAAMGPMLVPRALLPRAIGWGSLAWQSSAILGPALGGFLVSLTPAAGY